MGVDKENGMLVFPGGKRQRYDNAFCETPVEACVRELCEEFLLDNIVSFDTPSGKVGEGSIVLRIDTEWGLRQLNGMLYFIVNIDGEIDGVPYWQIILENHARRYRGTDLSITQLEISMVMPISTADEFDIVDTNVLDDTYSDKYRLSDTPVPELFASIIMRAYLYRPAFYPAMSIRMKYVAIASSYHIKFLERIQLHR